MTDPAEALDKRLSWWDREKFKVGLLLGAVGMLFMVWLAK